MYFEVILSVIDFFFLKTEIILKKIDYIINKRTKIFIATCTAAILDDANIYLKNSNSEIAVFIARD